MPRVSSSIAMASVLFFLPSARFVAGASAAPPDPTTETVAWDADWEFRYFALVELRCAGKLNDAQEAAFQTMASRRSAQFVAAERRESELVRGEMAACDAALAALETSVPRTVAEVASADDAIARAEGAMVAAVERSSAKREHARAFFGAIVAFPEDWSSAPVLAVYAARADAWADSAASLRADLRSLRVAATAYSAEIRSADAALARRARSTNPGGPLRAAG